MVQASGVHGTCRRTTGHNDSVLPKWIPQALGTVVQTRLFFHRDDLADKCSMYITHCQTIAI